MEAAVIVGTMTDDQNLIAAAALHDVVEDAEITIDEVEKKFGKRVRELVESETEDKRADLPPSDTWRIRKEETLSILRDTDDIGVLMVWIGDKLANMRSIYRDWKVDGDAMWQRFNQKNVNEQAWYYRSIVELTERLSHTSAWIEYKTLTEIVFGKGE
jgi:myo-inositol-1(or 4)-monophosphatase